MLNLFEKKTPENFTFFPHTLNSKDITKYPLNKLGNENYISPLPNNIGDTRHYPPAIQEWKDSVYSYNENYIKSLPIVDGLVNELIKSYFNLSPLLKMKKSKRVQVRFKRLSLNRILVSKAEMKHTNHKVIITVYLYNRNKKFFYNKLKNLYKVFLFKNIPNLNNKLASQNGFTKNIARKTQNIFTKHINKAITLIAPKKLNSNNLKNSNLSLTENKNLTAKPQNFSTKNKNLSKFSSKRFKSSNKLYTKKIKTNFSLAFTNLTKKTLSKFLFTIKNSHGLKDKYKSLVGKYYSLLSNYKPAINNNNISLSQSSISEKGSYSRDNNTSAYVTSSLYKNFFNTRRNKNYFKLFISSGEIKNSSNLINKNRKSRKIKNFIYKLRNLHRLFVISKMYNNIYTESNLSQNNPGGFALGLKKKFFGLKNLYKILKKSSLKESSIIKKINIVSLKGSRIIRKVRKHKNFIIKTLKWKNQNFLNYETKYYKNFIQKSYSKEMLYLYYTQMLSFNNNKFKNWFLLGLKEIISKIYHKKVEFNFVNLKYLHLNSDIFSESIAIKLRKRQNRLLSVLKKALKLVKLPSLNKLSFYDKKVHKKFINKYKTLNLNTFISMLSKDKDVLQGLLYKIFPNMGKTKSSNLSQKKTSLLKNVLNSIKHKAVYGVRLEATGRLSRRLTASRSVFKLKYKGSLKNIDSSYKNLSSVMLRGNTKSNIQYTKISSKTRNGSFGLKGWVSSY